MAQFGLIGLAVMGENLALNIERQGFPVAVYNRTAEKTDSFIAQRADGKNIVATYSPKELVAALERRDYFGSHTYHRIDQPGTFHTEWTQVDAESLQTGTAD